MLHAIGFPDDQMPQLLVHGWWNLGGAKMSKSAGNVIDPFVLADKYGAEAVRYYLMSAIVTGKDADFAEEQLISCFETDLANVIGNLLNRSLPMIWNFADGKLSKVDANNLPDASGISEMRNLANSEIPSALRIYERNFTETSRIDLAFGQPIALGLYCNGLIQITAPWKLAKNKDQRIILDAVLYHLAETLRVIAILIAPVLPKAAQGIFDQLNWNMKLSGKEERFSLNDAKWGELPDGHVVGKPVPLFPRIEIDKSV
jgi:methionyl-tRNA synthetase